VVKHEGYTIKRQGAQIKTWRGVFILFDRARGDRISVGGVVDYIKRIALIFLKQPHPTLIPANLQGIWP
jgi:hypothetical protein